MARLITLLEQHLDRQPPTVVTQATPWWETILALVKLLEIGLGGHLPVKVWAISLFSYVHMHKKHNNMSLGLAYLIAHTSELNCDIHICDLLTVKFYNKFSVSTRPTAIVF